MVRLSISCFDRIAPCTSLGPTSMILNGNLFDSEITGLGVLLHPKLRPVSAKSPLSKDNLKAAFDTVSISERNYLHVLRQRGYTALVDTAFADSRSAVHAFMNPSRSPEQAQSSYWREQGVRILTSCPCAILEAFNVVCIFTLARCGSFSFLPACRRFPLTLPVTMGVH
jgi:hypothetical protein